MTAPLAAARANRRPAPARWGGLSLPPGVPRNTPAVGTGRRFTYPPKPVPGDRVAVVSPSWAGPAVFPAVYELGLRRLREVFGLVPVEYPTTRRLDASPRERAGDLHAAFTDPAIKAVLATIGGEDQIRVLRFLDPRLLLAHPKPFLGFSDNTNLLLYLWNLGIVGYHGGAVMVHFARPGRLHPLTEASLRAALLGSGPVELTRSPDYRDEDVDWADPTALAREPPMRPADDDWLWAGPTKRVSGPCWGGCLEILDFQLRAGRYLLDPDRYAGAVLLLETSEELPSATYVHRVLLGLGERGMLERFAAVLVGRPKAWSFERPLGPADRQRYAEEQQAAVLAALAEYNPGAPAVFGLDVGHTDPQLVVPIGGMTVVDAAARRVEVTY
jgi:muramoyltetrapeptide carboxypeptidase LdcA involved in peptidoglycan recycling